MERLRLLGNVGSDTSRSSVQCCCDKKINGHMTSAAKVTQNLRKNLESYSEDTSLTFFRGGAPGRSGGWRRSYSEGR